MKNLEKPIYFITSFSTALMVGAVFMIATLWILFLGAVCFRKGGAYILLGFLIKGGLIPLAMVVSHQLVRFASGFEELKDLPVQNPAMPWYYGFLVGIFTVLGIAFFNFNKLIDYSGW